MSTFQKIVGAVAAVALPTAVLAWPQWYGSHRAPVSEAQPRMNGPQGESADMGDLVYEASQMMIERAGALAKDRPIVVTTMVEIDDFSRSSRFGRLSSTLISDRIAQRGYTIRDLNYTGALAIAPGTGELVLSRDATRISQQVNAQAVVAGTYAVAGREIYLSMRLIRADDGVVLSTADVVIPLDHNTEPLLVETEARR